MKKKTLNVKGSMVPVMAAVVLTMGWMLLPVPAAWAVPVVLENGPATFSASDMQGEAIGDVEASSFQLIGKTQDGKAVLFLDNQFVTVDMAAVREAVPQTAEKERNGFPDNLFPSGSFTVENPFPVGQISEENGKKPRDNRAWDDRQAQRVGTEPINADIDSSGQCTENKIKNLVQMFYKQLFDHRTSEHLRRACSMTASIS